MATPLLARQVCPFSSGISIWRKCLHLGLATIEIKTISCGKPLMEAKSYMSIPESVSFTPESVQSLDDKKQEGCKAAI